MNKQSLRQEALTLMASWEWFEHLPPEAHGWLADRAVYKAYSREQVVFTEGEEATHVYGISSGSFRLYMSADSGAEITISKTTRPRWFPMLIPTQQTFHQLNCVCVADAEVVAFSWADIYECGRRWPRLYMGLVDNLGQETLLAVVRIELLSLQSLEVRLAAYLLILAGARGKTLPEGGIFIPGEETQAELSSILGGTRQLLHRIYRAWTDDRVVHRSRQGTTIQNLAALRAIVDESGFDLAGHLDRARALGRG